MRAAGVVAAVAIAAASIAWSPSWLGAAGTAILVGMAASPLLPASTRPGAQWIGKHVLWIAIALLGASLHREQLRTLGPEAFLLASIAIAAAFVAVPLGRLLGLERASAWLLGIGTGVCGASAIAAARDSVGGSEEDAVQAVAVVTLMGTVGLVALPAIVAAAGIPGLTGAEWAGASLHAVPHAVAAGSLMAGPGGAAAAGLVKMTRVALLPLVLLGLTMLRRTKVPSEVVGLLSVALLASFLSQEALVVLQELDRLAFTLAFAGLGLATPWRSMRRAGGRVAWVAVATWLAVLAATLGVLSILAR